ncbi:disease resistance protein RPP4-like [Cucurbita moschata]|uniref:Disease resistance protein RPP4-like n=1 Tax=Cucurbita moschata TaxID=3662 RepID=A0A6J1G591_CUCMO|nr:disease resistance protein RPP4-like [Cucurbita moschata]
MDSSIAMTQSPALSPNDVFLNFRGEDTDPTSPVILTWPCGKRESTSSLMTSSTGENLLHEILKEDLKFGNLDKGINIIRHRLRSKKVLIAVDDVDKLEPLEALVSGRDWFGPGSVIIVTTRNHHLLSIHEFDKKVWYSKNES